MAAPGSEKSSKKKTEKKLAAREEAKLLASFMGVMNTMRKQVRGGSAPLPSNVRPPGRALAQRPPMAALLRLGCSGGPFPTAAREQ